MDNSIPAGSIVVGIEGIDGWPESRRALDWAVEQATREGRPLVIAHATGRDPTTVARDRQAAREARLLNGEGHAGVAKGLARRAAPGLDISSVVRAEGAADLLLDLARTAHLVVVGSRGLGPVASVVHGSVGLLVSSRATVPVVIVREPPAPVVLRIVVGADGREGSADALEFGFAEASARAVPLTVLTCLDDDADLAAVEESVEGLARKYEDVRSDVRSAQGRAAEALVEESRTADLLVVGARGQHTRAAALLGSVSQAAAERSACTVAVVRRVDDGR